MDVYRSGTALAGRGLVVFFSLAAVLMTAGACRRDRKAAADPYNVPAEVLVEGDRVVFTYLGKAVFSGRVEAYGGPFSVTNNVFRSGRAVSSVLAITAAPGGRAGVKGNVTASSQSFPCEADRKNGGPALVRHVSGLSLSRLNRAVYDRGSDWVFSVDAGPLAMVAPAGDDAKNRTFNLETGGREIILRFRPAFYRIHRGLEFFEPWTYEIWPEPVAGWISWFAFYDEITEADVVETADTLAVTLRPFGYDYLQIDDGYQRGNGLPDLWLKANDKFPAGLGFLADYIKDKGLKPGIWTNVAFEQADFARAHPDWFVTGAGGEPAGGNWIGFSLDASNDQALDSIARPVYRGLKEMGWQYFKVDALRHLRYEGYNAHADYFARKKTSLIAAFRKYGEVIREEVGRENFILGCWGIRPELAGLIDGCRIGTDGFAYAGLAQFNSWNNVVWRNDPDHIQLDEERYRSLLVTSLTGSILLLTDKPAVYRTEAAEAARRAAPVLRTLPGQVFDVDASRSNLLGRVETEVSGSGPRPFDAGGEPACDLWLLEIVRPFENWLVLGRTGEREKEIHFADLGLDPEKEYLVFEFWAKKPVGSFMASFKPGPLDQSFRSQSLIIRERKNRPQLLATSRHLTGGGVDLLDVQWAGSSLSGKSRLTGGDPYELYLNVPEGFGLDDVEVAEADLVGIFREGLVHRIKISSAKDADVSWKVTFSGGL